VKGDKISGTHSTHGRDESTLFLSENMKRKGHFGELVVDGRTKLKLILKKQDVDFMHLAQDRDQ